MASNDKVKDVQRDVDGVKDSMLGNIDKMLSNQEKTADLEYKTNILSETSETFRRSSRNVRCHYLRQNIKLYSIIFGLLLFFILMIVLIIINN